MGKKADQKRTPTKDDLTAFLESGINKMTDDEVRTQIAADKSKYPKTGMALVELQREGWDPLGFNRDTGCEALDGLDDMFPSDQELHSLRDKFVHTAMETYLELLRRRKPDTLETVKPLKRPVLMEFFDACNTKMDTPSFREALRKHMQETAKMPNDEIIEAQKDLLEILGFERAHGCACLEKIGSQYPDDKEVLQKFQMWQRKAKDTLMQVARDFQAGGGQLDVSGQLGVVKELEACLDEARSSVESMTPEEKEDLITKMQPKLKIFMNLPKEAKESYIKKMAHTDKLNFAKAQWLFASVMRKQWEAQQRGEPGAMASAPGSQQMTMDGGGGGGYGGDQSKIGSAAAAKPVEKPTQQQMM